MLPLILTVCGAVALVPYIYFRARKIMLPALFLKAVVSIFFILTAAAASLRGLDQAASQGALIPYGRLCAGLVMGLVFGLLGDIWLDLKDMYDAHRDAYIFAGFLSFFVGHLCFIATLLAVYGTTWGKLLCTLGVAIIMVLIVLLMEKPLRYNYGRFKAISLGYGFIIVFMVATAFAAAFPNGAAPLLWPLQPRIMAAGGILFLFSDLVLCGIYFGQGKDGARRAPGETVVSGPAPIILNYVLYYAGQFTIALSLAFMGH